ncbi:MAG: hypothetical protein IPN46_01940 [Saprospiraceae bacterium]|nr:hypothetical protein [Saprospiraceae bacterium]
MDACNPGGPYIACNGNANTGTITVNASQLEPCKTYIFWIDGWAGSVCSYYIQVVGDFHVCELPPIEDITIDQACNPLCPVLGTLPVTVVPAPGPPNLENINGVTLHWDVSFNGAPYISTMTQSYTDGLTLDIPFLQAGEYEICVAPNIHARVFHLHSVKPLCLKISHPSIKNIKFVPRIFHGKER